MYNIKLFSLFLIISSLNSNITILLFFLIFRSEYDLFNNTLLFIYDKYIFID